MLRCTFNTTFPKRPPEFPNVFFLELDKNLRSLEVIKTWDPGT